MHQNEDCDLNGRITWAGIKMVMTMNSLISELYSLCSAKLKVIGGLPLREGTQFGGIRNVIGF